MAGKNQNEAGLFRKGINLILIKKKKCKVLFTRFHMQVPFPECP